MGDNSETEVGVMEKKLKDSVEEFNDKRGGPNWKLLLDIDGDDWEYADGWAEYEKADSIESLLSKVLADAIDLRRDYAMARSGVYHAPSELRKTMHSIVEWHRMKIAELRTSLKYLDSYFTGCNPTNIEPLKVLNIFGEEDEESKS